MTLNDRSTPLVLLSSRRSGKPRDLVAPGPDAAQLDRILTIAARTPDHGKLAPWRFVVVPEARRDAFAALLPDAYLAERPEAKRLELEAVAQFARQAPTPVVALSATRTESHITLMGQPMSAGAACMTQIGRTTGGERVCETWV